MQGGGPFFTTPPAYPSRRCEMLRAEGKLLQSWVRVPVRTLPVSASVYQDLSGRP
jgi:hypothetical protein